MNRQDSHGGQTRLWWTDKTLLDRQDSDGHTRLSWCNGQTRLWWTESDKTLVVWWTDIDGRCASPVSKCVSARASRLSTYKTDKTLVDRQDCGGQTRLWWTDKTLVNKQDSSGQTRLWWTNKVKSLVNKQESDGQTRLWWTDKTVVDGQDSGEQVRALIWLWNASRILNSCPMSGAAGHVKIKLLIFLNYN